MSPIFDWKCPRHGVFEGSHAICPTLGCDSHGVEKVFLKAPGVKSDYTKRFDAGIRQSADMYRQSDFKSARAGESAKANNRANELKWGDDAAAFLGGDLQATLPRGPADGVPALGFVQEHGTPNPLMRAERTKAADDNKNAAQLKALAAPKTT